MTDMSAHPTTEALAAYAAGDLEPAPAGAVAGHLGECADCAADLAAIERATASLRALPALHMPLDVVAAVDRALGAEARGAVPSLAARRARRPSLPPFAAAAAVLGLVAAVGYGTLRGGTGGDDSSGALRAESGADRDAAVADAAGPILLRSGTDYTPSALDGQVRGALAGGAPAALTAAEPGTQDDAAAGSAGGDVSFTAEAKLSVDDPDLRSCITELSGTPDAVPILVDEATFSDQTRRAQPAWIVVLPFREDRVDVFVVGRDCRTGNDSLLLFKRITRS